MITGTLSKSQYALSNRLDFAHIPRRPRPNLPQHLETAERHPDLIPCDGEVLPLEKSTASREERQRPFADHARREGCVVESADWQSQQTDLGLYRPQDSSRMDVD